MYGRITTSEETILRARAGELDRELQELNKQRNSKARNTRIEIVQSERAAVSRLIAQFPVQYSANLMVDEFLRDSNQELRTNEVRFASIKKSIGEDPIYEIRRSYDDLVKAHTKVEFINNLLNDIIYQACVDRKFSVLKLVEITEQAMSSARNTAMRYVRSGFNSQNPMTDAAELFKAQALLEMVEGEYTFQNLYYTMREFKRQLEAGTVIFDEPAVNPDWDLYFAVVTPDRRANYAPEYERVGEFVAAHNPAQAFEKMEKSFTPDDRHYANWAESGCPMERVSTKEIIFMQEMSDWETLEFPNVVSIQAHNNFEARRIYRHMSDKADYGSPFRNFDGYADPARLVRERVAEG